MASLGQTEARNFGLVVLASCFCVGCALVPPEKDIAPIKPLASYATARSLAGAVGTWPSDHWWQDYRDPQLTSLIEEGLTGASDMRIAAARLAIATAAVGPAQGALFPTLAASGKIDRERQSYKYLMPEQAVPKGWNDAGIGTLSLDWEIDFWGKNRAALAAASSQAEAAAAEAAATRLALSTGIAEVYAQLAALHAGRDAAENAVRVRKATLDLMTSRFQNQLENEGALERSRSAEAAAESELAETDEKIALVRNQLAALVGAGPDRGLSIGRPKVTGGRYVGVPVRLPLELVGRRPDIVAARLHAEAAAHSVDSARAAFYPNVNLAGMIGRQALGINLLTSSGATLGSLGPTVSLPILDGGRLRAGKETADSQYDIAVATYDKTLTDALQQVSDALISKRALVQRLADTRRSVEAAQKAWTVVRDRYNGGLATYIEVLTAEDALIQTRYALAALQTRAFALDVALVRALGGGYRNQENAS